MTRKHASIVVVFVLQWFVAGCGLYDVVPAGTTLIDETYSYQIPYMNGDHDRIARVRCRLLQPPQGSLFRGACEAALSNGVSDLANDLHTGVDILDAFRRDDLEARLKSAATAACFNYVNGEGIPALKWYAALGGNWGGMPWLGNAVGGYIDRHSVGLRSYFWCETAVRRAWDETNDNTYSGGHRCAVGQVTITVRDMDHPPDVSFATFPRHESSSLCPRARVDLDILPFGGGPWWGND